MSGDGNGKALSFEEWRRKRDKRVRSERARQRQRENPEAGSEAAAKRRERYYARPYSVYKVEFSDGMVYVGTTCQDIRTRLSGHRYKCTVVGRRLDMGEAPKVSVLGEFPRDPDLAVREDPLRAEARRFEQSVLDAVPVLQRLNLRRAVEDVAIQLGTMRANDIQAFVDEPELLGPLPEPVYPRPVPEAEEWFSGQEEAELDGGDSPLVVE